MLTYRDQRTGKIYRAVKGPYGDLGAIITKEGDDAEWAFGGEGNGPFASREVAEKVLRDRAKRFHWEEISND